MKLKSTIAALLLTTSLSVFAVDITLSPVYTVVGLVQTALESVVGIASSPLASTSASSQQREQLKAIRTDALNFLAGEDMTKNLEQVITKLQESEELAGRSPQELSAHIVTAIN
jgi:hypothetical protein